MAWLKTPGSIAGKWLLGFGLYAAFELLLQLTYWFLLNSFGPSPVTNIEFHLIMWVFQCVLLIPIWFVGAAIYARPAYQQIVLHTIFFAIYCFVWYSMVQHWIASIHQHVQSLTRSPGDRIASETDSIALIHYQIIKHVFRLGWFFLIMFVIRYKIETIKREQTILQNREMEMNLLKWELNPTFYFRTIDQMAETASHSPAACSTAILQLARVMEHVIYNTRERTIPLEREIRFAHDYIDLINRNHYLNPVFFLRVNGNTGELKIAPLLITDIIDRMLIKTKGIRTPIQLHLNISSREMLLHTSTNEPEIFFQFLKSNDDALYKRLQTLYPMRYNYLLNGAGDSLEIRLQLDV